MTIKLPQKICILDIEVEYNKETKNTKLLFVGTKIYSLHNEQYRPHKYKPYLPSHSKKLEKFLREFPGIIIGHHILVHDYKVLQKYLISLDGIIEKDFDGMR